MASPRYEMRPLGPWIGPVTKDRQPSSRFRALWIATLDELKTETGMLGAQMVVVQVDVTDGELRRDGMLRANAKVAFPGVRISFDSLHGSLSYATDRYDSWQANVRAIVLSLTALRAVDRYGITRSGEQYVGWNAIQAKAAEHTLTVAEAARVLADAAGISASTLERSAAVIADARTKSPVVAAESVSESRGVVEAAYRKAAKASHPDHGGDAGVFRLVTAARDILIGADRG